MQEEFKKFNIKTNYDTSKVSWLKSGGIAKYFCNIKNVIQLTELFEFLNKNKIPFLTIGNFSNTLIKSSGFDGLLLKLSGDFSNINLNQETVTVGSSVLDLKFSMFCYEKSICDYEYLYTIPGTIGGNIFMNAGCYGFEIKDQIHKIKTFDTLTLKIQELSGDEINFSYRKGFQEKNKIILSVELIAKLGSRDNIKRRMKELDQKRNETQPRRAKCCGSIFKNPIVRSQDLDNEFLAGHRWDQVDGYTKLSSARLIELIEPELNIPDTLRLYENHSLVLINNGEASFDDVISVLNQIKSKIFKKFKIKLEIEPEIISS